MNITNFINQKKLENKSSKTIISYSAGLKDFSKYVKSRKLSQDIIKAYLVDMQSKGLKPRTIRHRLVAIREYLCFVGLPKIIPNIKIKVDKKLPSVLTQEEVSKLVDGLKACRDKIIVKLLYSTGMRISELVSLDESVVNDIQFKITGKGNKERNIFIQKDLFQEIKKFKTGSGALFKNRFGNRLSVVYITKIISRCGKLILNKRVHPHMLRSSYATRLFNSGVDILNVSKALGHESVATTQIYVSVSGERLGNIINEAWNRKELVAK